MFITFEGTEGSGKTTQIKLLATSLQQLGYQVCCTREPGGTAIGNQIRHILHDVNNREMTAEAEILLYAASRAQLVRELILPKLNQKQIVLCDRYVESTYAYQGYGRGLNFEILRHLSAFATQELRPDLIIYLDLDIDVGLQRKQVGQAEMNRMDQQTRDFYERVHQGYYEMAQTEPARWLIIPASADVEVIQARIYQQIQPLLQ